MMRIVQFVFFGILCSLRCSMGLKMGDPNAMGAMSGCPTKPEQAPTSSEELSLILSKWATCNRTQYDYFLPSEFTSDLHKNWIPTWNCESSDNCWCSHVKGDLDKKVNPDGWKTCEHLSGKGNSSYVAECASLKKKSCKCYTGRGKPCLYGHMSPGKLLYVLALAKATGATHIVEEGREGGLSAFAYNLHGLKVTSVEYLPLDPVTKALNQLAPGIAQVNGDGGVLVPQIIGNLTDAEAARTIVMFDGEKRWGAYKTFKRIQGRVAAGIFDDTQVDEDFVKMLRNSHAVIDTKTDPHFAEFKKIHETLLPQMGKLFDEYEMKVTTGHVRGAEYAIVKGGAWQ